MTHPDGYLPYYLTFVRTHSPPNQPTAHHPSIPDLNNGNHPRSNLLHLSTRIPQTVLRPSAPNTHAASGAYVRCREYTHGCYARAGGEGCRE